MRKNIALFEIFLIVCASVAFAYILSDAQEIIPIYSEMSESSLIQKIRTGFINVFGGNLVSAAEEGLWTCALDKNGTRCQEYQAQICNSLCTTSCFPGLRADFAECKLGTCLDATEGTCSPNSPKAACEQQGGSWDARQKSEITECREGCCLIGNQALYKTEQQCNTLRDRLGQPIIFTPVDSELQCIAMANKGEEGACVLETVDFDKNNCKFTTKEQCTTLSGNFYKGMLCSNPSLGTACVKQKRTGCVDGKDEVYWFDSCGNRENIYDSLHKDQSWNNGIVLAKNQSCELGTSLNPLSKQSSCGNCNYLAGSVCGTQRVGIDDKPSVGDFVCRDLSCTDENGNKRKHGESWCAFDSQIGVQGLGNLQRSVDLPGSEQYRKSCINGEVRTETCGVARNSLCVESRDEQAKFSSAACRANQWQLCVQANDAGKDAPDPGTAAELVKKECSKYTDCVLKGTDLRSGGKDTFAFNVCVPRNPPGFDLGVPNGGEVAETICGMATAPCTYVKVKKLFGKSEYNKVCRTSAFTEAMNNLCMSMGDCGGKVSIEGDYTDEGYRVTNAPKVGQSYIAALKLLTTPKEGQHVSPLNESELVSLYGLIGNLQDPNVKNSYGKMLTNFAKISGASGILLAYAVYAGWIGPATTTIPAKVIVGSLADGSATSTTATQAPALGAYAGAAAGALIGAAGTAYLIHALGIDAGLPPAVTYALIAAGAVGGAFIGYGLVNGGALVVAGSLAATGIGLIIVAVVVIIIFVLKFLGIGKKSETKVTFQCMAWQPPLGGAKCTQCGADGLPCSRYKCQSLGQSCTFVDDSAEGKCVDSSPNDVTPPIISEDKSVLLGGYQYTQVSGQGYHLQGSEPNGCVPVFNQIRLGIATNELSQCKVTNKHTASYDDMDTFFHQAGGIQSSLFRKNHTMTFTIPSKQAIDNRNAENAEHASDEVFDPELFEPDQSGNVNLYVRCTDAAGRKNVQEYAINFCVSPEPDRTPPVISGFSPASPGYVSLNASSKNVKFFLNEPAECRWNEQDVAYNAMTHNATCAGELAESTLLGWPCNMTLPTPATGDKTFYVRCNDQPFLENATGRNANQQSVSYVLRKTQTPLSIVSIDPQGKIISTNGLPAKIDLTVVTRGGVPELSRTCSFKWGTQSVLFFETGADTHRQRNLNIFVEGNYTIPITCEDAAGNNAGGSASFSVIVDDKGPMITRAYNLNGLTIITNEKSQCAFSLNSCSFNFANGTLMQGQELTHTSNFAADVKHYIICKDVFNNPSACISVQQARIT
jgi:hypothetical protein